MPEYLAPGVFVEETSFRAKSIEGVGTSVAAIVGPTRTGPVRGIPEVVTAFNEFERIYGDSEDLDFGGTKLLNHTAIAARNFFDNGGKQLYVTRVFKGVNDTDKDGVGGTALSASCATTGDALKFSSRFPGAMGNYWVELYWNKGEDLYSKTAVDTPKDGETLFLAATGIPRAAKVATATLPDDKFPIRVRALVTVNGDDLDIGNGIIEDKDGEAVAKAKLKGKLVLSKLPSTTRKLWRIRARAPLAGSLVEGTAATLGFSSETDLSKFTGAAHWDKTTTLRGTLNAAGDTFTVSAALNSTVTTDIAMNLAVLGGADTSVAITLYPTRFDLDVRNGGKNAEVIYSLADITATQGNKDSIDKRLATDPEKAADKGTQPIACRVKADTSDIVAELYKLFDDHAIDQPDLITGPRYLIELQNGSDGQAPMAADYGGETDEIKGGTGLKAFRELEDISIVMTPAAAADKVNHQAIVVELQKHCLKMRYRVGLVDSREDMSIGEVQRFRNQIGNDSRLALYHPWVVMSDPSGRRQELVVPPAGFMAGIYARTDVDRGVHKAPANTLVVGALRFNQSINKFQQELLNPRGINCLRSFPGRGHQVWGGRTLSTDPEWKYINVRRYFLYLERSIEKSTQWVVFEPNGDRLWRNVRTTVEDFLYNEWSNGHLFGAKPEAAYFVRCDRSTMTRNDLDNGRLVCLIGVAPLRPAEFVIFRIGQKTAEAWGETQHGNPKKHPLFGLQLSGRAR